MPSLRGGSSARSEADAPALSRLTGAIAVARQADAGCPIAVAAPRLASASAIGAVIRWHPLDYCPTAKRERAA